MFPDGNLLFYIGNMQAYPNSSRTTPLDRPSIVLFAVNIICRPGFSVDDEPGAGAWRYFDLKICILNRTSSMMLGAWNMKIRNFRMNRLIFDEFPEP